MRMVLMLVIFENFLENFWHFQFIFANDFSTKKFLDAENLGHGQLQPCGTNFQKTTALQAMCFEI